MKNIISEMKNTCNGNNRLDNIEDKINDLADRTESSFFFK